MRANATSSAPEWRKSSDQGPNPRHRRTSTREGNRGNRGGRGGGRGGNGGGPPRKDPTPASQDTTAPSPKLVVDPPTATNTPPEPSSASKPNSRPKPTRRHSATVEESTSISSQPNPRPPNKRRRSQQGKPSATSSNTPSKLLNVQTLSRKASTGPPSPNPAKDPPPHLSPAASTATPKELKSDIDALVERVRAVAMDRPHTPGSHIDWADDDDSLPDLNDWGYTGDANAPVQPEEPPASIPPILEDVPLQPGIPEVKIEGEPSPDETKPQDAKPGPASDPAPRTHKVQKTRSKRGGRLRGDLRTQQPPPALNLTDSASQGPPLSPIQPAVTSAPPHTTRPQGQKRQNPNQGQNSRNNQGRTNPRDNGGGNGGGRQRGQNGAAAASPTRNSFPAKTGPKADHTPPIQSQAPAQGQSPDIAQSTTNPPAEPVPKPLESKGEMVPDDGRKKGTLVEIPPTTDTNDPPNPTATKHTRELDLTDNNPQPNPPKDQTNKRNSYNPSHARAHTYGGRTQNSLQPPHSAPTPNFPHHPSDTSPNPPRNPRSPNLPHSPGMRTSGLGPGPKNAGYERHNRNHSSPSGVGGATRAPHQTRPVITGDAISRLARTLGSTPGSPKKDPPVPQPAS